MVGSVSGLLEALDPEPCFVFVFYLLHRKQQRVKQNEETEDYLPNERTRYNFRKNLNESDFIYPDRVQGSSH